MTHIADKLMRGTVLYRDVVGRKVRLVGTLRSKGGILFRKGQVLDVKVTHQGRFTLQCLSKRGASISRVPPAYFELEEEIDK